MFGFDEIYNDLLLEAKSPEEIKKILEYQFVQGKGVPQEILDRTSVIVNEKEIEVRIEVGFPARGRSVLAKELEKILYELFLILLFFSIFTAA